MIFISQLREEYGFLISRKCYVQGGFAQKAIEGSRFCKAQHILQNLPIVARGTNSKVLAPQSQHPGSQNLEQTDCTAK
jgi:hypothetical protein